MHPGSHSEPEETVSGLSGRQQDPVGSKSDPEIMHTSSLLSKSTRQTAWMIGHLASCMPSDIEI